VAPTADAAKVITANPCHYDPQPRELLKKLDDLSNESLNWIHRRNPVLLDLSKDQPLAIDNVLPACSINLDQSLANETLPPPGALGLSKIVDRINDYQSPQRTLWPFQRSPYYEVSKYIDSGGTPLPLGENTKSYVEGISGAPASAITHKGLKEAIEEIMKLSPNEQSNRLLIVEGPNDLSESITRIKLKTEQASGVPVTVQNDKQDNGTFKVKFLDPQGQVLANLTIADSSNVGNTRLTKWSQQEIIIGNASVRGFVQLSTGTGKTVLFSKMIEQYLVNNPNRTGTEEQSAKSRKVLVAVHTTRLREQTIEAIKEWSERINVVGYPLQKGENYGDADVVVSCYQSLTSRPAEFQKLGFDLVILDEAHQVLGPERSKVVVGSPGENDDVTMDELKGSLNALASSCTDIVGFTATPNYREKTSSGKVVTKRGIQELLPHNITSMTLQEAQGNGYLASLHPAAPFGTCIVTTRERITEIKDGLKNTRRSQASETVDQRMIHEEAVYLARLDSVAKIVAPKEGRPVEKTIIFCSRVEDVERLRDDLLGLGYTACAFTGEEKAGYEGFKNGYLDIMISTKIGDQGIDLPSLRTGIFWDPSSSFLRREQQIGRVLRLDPKDGSKEIKLFELSIESQVKRSHIRLGEILQGNTEGPGTRHHNPPDQASMVEWRIGVTDSALHKGPKWMDSSISGTIEPASPNRENSKSDIENIGNVREHGQVFGDGLKKTGVQLARNREKSLGAVKTQDGEGEPIERIGQLYWHCATSDIDNYMELFASGELQESWIDSSTIQTLLGLSNFALSAYCMEYAGKGDWVEFKVSGESKKGIWISPEMEAVLSKALLHGLLPNNSWNTAAKLAVECGLDTADLNKIIADPMTEKILPGHLVSVKFDGQDATLVSPAGERYIRSVIRRTLNSVKPSESQPRRKNGSVSGNGSSLLSPKFQEGIDRYRGFFSHYNTGSEPEFLLLTGDFRNVDGAVNDMNVQREKGLTFERVTHYGLLISGESAIPQVLLTNGNSYIIPDFYSSSSNRIVEVKWGGDGPGIAEALSKGNYYRTSKSTRHLPEKEPGYLLIHHVDNKSLKEFTQHNIEVCQMSSSAVGADVGTTRVSPDPDAVRCHKLLLEHMEEAMTLPPEKVQERLQTVRIAAESVITQRLGLDQNREYGNLRSEDFAKACNNGDGATELEFVQRILSGKIIETTRLPVNSFVYLVDQDRMVPTPVDIGALELLRSTGLHKLKTELDLLQKGSGKGSLINALQAFNSASIEGMSENQDHLSITMAAAEGVMRCFSSSLSFDSKRLVPSSEDRTELAVQARKWQGASDFVRGGAFGNRRLSKELTLFSRRCTQIQSSLGMKSLNLSKEQVDLISEDRQLIELIRINQYQYDRLQPFMGNLLRDQSMALARWSLEHCPKHQRVFDVMAEFHSVGYEAAAATISYPEKGSKEQRKAFAEEKLPEFASFRNRLIQQAINLRLENLSTSSVKELEVLKNHPSSQEVREYCEKSTSPYRVTLDSESVKKLFQGSGLPRDLRRNSSKLALEGLS
jgi:superfamily II DNA or RNA helicase